MSSGESAQAAVVVVGRVDEFGPESRKAVTVDGKKVVVLLVGDDLVAYENRCLHMGGPVGEGILLGRVEAVLDENKRLVCEQFSTEEIQLICPWHGWAYNARTGEFAGDNSMRLRKYETRVEDGMVYVVT